VISQVFFVHGYSVTSLDAYAKFPLFLSSQFVATNIFLSAFNSLDDAITCDDLATALENHISGLESTSKIDVGTTAFICHSTGAIVTRRWILNRLQAGKPTPSHLITLAGANHGSTLAQLGETMAASVFRELAQGTSVGQGVLTDLDYGSDFLLRLNQEWLDAVNGPLATMYVFSMGGDSIGDWIKSIIWQTKEPGSDSTVRISGANLNYSILEADADLRTIAIKTPSRPVPHLVIAGYSHTGASNGIIDSVQSPTEAPFAAVTDALAVGNDAQYQAVLVKWQATTTQWIADNAAKGNVASTLVFHLADRANRPINDSFIVLQDSATNASAVSTSLIGRPIQNKVIGASVSFYVNESVFQNTSPHVVTVHANSGSDEIDYVDLTYTVSPGVGRLVSPNETTYVFVRMNRDTKNTYMLYNYDPNLPTTPPWPPFPPGSIPLIAPSTSG
jgi:hypothetical protein